MLPKRKAKVRMGLRQSSVVRSPGHLQVVRTRWDCCLAGRAPTPCCGKVSAHHLQSFRAIEGGMGMKVGDDKTVPLCDAHHIPYVHQKGQPAVEKETGVDLEKVAAACWQEDIYHRLKWEASQK